MHLCSYYVRDSCRRQISFVLRLNIPTLQNVAHHAIHARFVMYILPSIVIVLFCMQRRIGIEAGVRDMARRCHSDNNAGNSHTSTYTHTYIHIREFPSNRQTALIQESAATSSITIIDPGDDLLSNTLFTDRLNKLPVPLHHSSN